MKETSINTSTNLETEFQKFISEHATFSDEDLLNFRNKFQHKTLKKNTLFVESGKVCSKVAFFNQGYFRFYYLLENGNETTCDFHFGPGFITSYTSLITQEPSFVNVQAMTDMETLEISRSDLYQLYDASPAMEKIGRKMAEITAINSEKHLFLLLNQSAEIRYKNLLSKYPQYVQEIPLQYIASFLGIAKESLSRIRKSMV